jgi:ABC-type bacteriocin/lantibiotic exporter with double-glycine peptidase domain
MNTELPLYGQEKRETCALACLRMVLAAHGARIAESVIEAEARMLPGGTEIEELQRLASRFGLVADIERVTAEQLRRILEEGKLPIAHINRAFFDLASLHRVRRAIRAPLLHAVIPIRLTQHFVTFHDPI